MYDVFISYSRKDVQVIDRIEKELEKYGIKMFIDRAGIDAGTDWAETIAQALYESEVVLFVWSENSNTSVNTANEIALAIDYQKTIVPFKIGEFKADFKLSYRLIRFNRIDALPYNEGKVVELGQKLAKLLGKTRAAAQPTPVQKEAVAVPQEDNTRLELLYKTGLESFKQFHLNEAFQDLTEPALASYKDAQVMVAEIVSRRTRILHLSEDKFTPYKKAAEEGNGFALYVESRSAFHHQHDAELSYSLAKLSADQGCGYGMFEVAQSLEMGSGTEKNIKEGHVWRQKAIENGIIPAMLIQARDLAEGWTLKANPTKAIAMFEMLAEKYNNGEAYSRLGDIYYFGNYGKAVDLEKAEKLYQKAIEAGYAEAYYMWSFVYLYNTDGSNKEPESQKKGYDILMKGARLNETNALSTLGTLYYFGTFVKQDYQAAARWFKKSADLGDAYSCEMLSNMYYYATGVEENNEEAWNWAQKGYYWRASGCMYMAGIICMDGYAPEGTEKKECLKYFNLAVDQGGLGAENSLLKLYEIYRPDWYPMYQINEYREYDWAEKDKEKAVAALKRATEYGNNDAKYLYSIYLTDIDNPDADEFLGASMLEETASKQPMAYIRLAELSIEGVGKAFDQNYILEMCEKAKGAEVDATVIDLIVAKMRIQLLGDAEPTDENKREFNEILNQLQPCIDKKMPEAYTPYTKVLLSLVGEDSPEPQELKPTVYVDTSTPGVYCVIKTSGKSSGSPTGGNHSSYDDRFFQAASDYAEMNLMQAVLDLGVCYNLGIGVGKNDAKALEYYTKAAELGSNRGAFNAGEMYFEQNDKQQAKYWLRRALELGSDQQEKISKYLDQIG